MCHPFVTLYLDIPKMYSFQARSQKRLDLHPGLWPKYSKLVGFLTKNIILQPHPRPHSKSCLRHWFLHIFMNHPPPPVALKLKISSTTFSKNFFLKSHKKSNVIQLTEVPQLTKKQTKVKRTSDIFIKKPVRIPEIFETHCNRNRNHQRESLFRTFFF